MDEIREFCKDGRTQAVCALVWVFVAVAFASAGVTVMVAMACIVAVITAFSAGSQLVFEVVEEQAERS